MFIMFINAWCDLLTVENTKLSRIKWIKNRQCTVVSSSRGIEERVYIIPFRPPFLASQRGIWIAP